MTFREDQNRTRNNAKAQRMRAMRNTSIALSALTGFSSVMEGARNIGRTKGKGVMARTHAENEMTLVSLVNVTYGPCV